MRILKCTLKALSPTTPGPRLKTVQRSESDPMLLRSGTLPTSLAGAEAHVRPPIGLPCSADGAQSSVPELTALRQLCEIARVVTEE